MTRRRSLFLSLVLALFLSGATCGVPRETTGSLCLRSVCFEKAKQIAGSEVPLRGAGLMEYWFFDLYTAAFYAPKESGDPEAVLRDVPKSLVLHYHRSIKKEWMAEAAEDRVRKNPDIDFSALRDRMQKIADAYRDVGKGDRYELRYEPGRGTSLYLNGEYQVTVPGKDFQKAYFGIWLSDLPINRDLRDRLIGTGKGGKS